MTLTEKRNVGCTKERHAQIGVHAQINARSDEQWRNSWSREQWEAWKDCQVIKGPSQFNGQNWNSKTAQKRLGHLKHKYLR